MNEAEDHEETEGLSQLVFGLLLEAEKCVLQEGKKLSLPGSIQPDGPQLLSTEDLKTQNKINNINAASGSFFKKKIFLFTPFQIWREACRIFVHLQDAKGQSTSLAKGQSPSGTVEDSVED